MVDYFTMDYILVFLAGIAIGLAIGISMILIRNRSERKLLKYLIDIYTQREDPNLPELKKTGLTDEEKAKYLRIVLKSIEKEDEKIRKKRKNREDY